MGIVFKFTTDKLLQQSVNVMVMDRSDQLHCLGDSFRRAVFLLLDTLLKSSLHLFFC